MMVPPGEDPSEWEPSEAGLMNVPGRLVKDNTTGEIRVATQEEHEAELLELSTAASARTARFKRDTLLNDADKLTQLDRWDSFTIEQKSNISNYKQALRDIPNQSGFPLNITWPELPIL